MEIASALASIKALGELTKLVADGKVDSAVKAKAAELNNSILSLQETVFSIQSQNHELLNANRAIEEEMLRLQNWENTASKYELHELCSGVFVFRFKPNEKSPEPPHYICPNCYNNQKPSILTKQNKKLSGTLYKCNAPECGATYNDYVNRSSYSL